MQPTPYDIALVGVGGTVLGVLLGAWLTYRFAMSLAESGALRLAGIKLREAFAPEIAKFSHPERVHPFASSNILEAAFEKHQAAVNEFRLYLKSHQLDGFDRAWQDYYYAPGNNPVDFSQYFGGIEEVKLALARMKAIVAFTKS